MNGKLYRLDPHSHIHVFTGVNYIPSQNPKRIEKLSDGRLLFHTESGQEFGPYDQVRVDCGVMTNDYNDGDDYDYDDGDDERL
jgi:hypothetical protein